MGLQIRMSATRQKQRRQLVSGIAVLSLVWWACSITWLFRISNITINDKLHKELIDPKNTSQRLANKVKTQDTLIRKQKERINTLKETLLETKLKLQSLTEINDEDNINNEKKTKNNNINIASLQTITHFLSHIPKAGGQYAWQEVLRLFQSTVVYPDNRTEDDIQTAQQQFYNHQKNKTDGRNFFITTQDEDWHNFPVDLKGITDAYTPSKLCQWGLKPLNQVNGYQIIKKKTSEQKLRVKCNVVVSERPWQDNIENVYTIIREPLSHVLSQYFHCTESSSHDTIIVRDGKEISHDCALFQSDLQFFRAACAASLFSSLTRKMERVLGTRMPEFGSPNIRCRKMN